MSAHSSRCLLLALVFGLPGVAQVAPPEDRITAEINDHLRVELADSVHPALASASSSQPVDSDFALDHMILTLQRSARQESELSDLLAQLQNPASDRFHKFLTPAQFTVAFGASSGDVKKITAWLTTKGFHVDDVASNLAIVFSGSAAQVESAFKTQMRRYVVNGETHYANASEPQIPAALSPVVRGLVKLNDFHSRPLAHGVRPLYTSGGTHDLAPADYATIYDLNSLYSGGDWGVAQTIAVLGRSDVNLSDISTFRSTYGLPAAGPIPVYATGTNPGISGNQDTLEMTLDVEWAGAVAPQANIKYVIAASTSSTDGVDLAAQYAVSHNIAPILSVSYAVCETTANNSYYKNLWEQAVIQGMTVLVAAGDDGADGCASATVSTGSPVTTGTGKAVNAICSTPYDTCVGGTMFDDTANPGQYWLAGNNSSLGSAVSYIPEVAWNESGSAGGSGLAAGGGGASAIYLKPYWQTGTGVPADGRRDVPDVAMSAAQHDGYLIYYQGAAMTVSGTSTATPAFAGIMALVNQKDGAGQGNINQVLYPMAVSYPSAFHDITSGNNSVPGVTGFSAGVGYDQVTGLGSVDGAQMVNNWANVTGGFALTASAYTVNVAPGANGSNTLTVTDLGAFVSPVSLSISNLPIGIIANFTRNGFSGGGTSVVSFSANGTSVTGTYSVTVTGSGGGFLRSVSFNLVVVDVASCTLAATPGTLTVVQSQATSTRLVCGNAEGGFGSSLTLSVSGVPSGVTTSFSPSTLNAGTGASVLIVNATSAAVVGSYTLLVTVTLPHSSPLFTSTVSVAVNVMAPTTFTVVSSMASLTLPQGASVGFTLTSAHVGSFNGAISFQTSGLPSSVSATLSTSTIAAPGDGSLSISLSALSIATPGSYTLLVLAQGGGLTLKIPIAVQVTAVPGFTLTESAAVLSLHQTYVPASGNPTPSTAAMTFRIGTLTNGFNLPVSFSVGALPSGVTAAFSNATLAAPTLAASGTGTTTLTLTASSTATTGISTFTVTATGGTLTRSVNVQLTVTPPSIFSLSVNYPSYTLIAGNTMDETVTSTPLYGYQGNVALSATAATGFNIVFSPVSINGAYGTSLMTIQPAASMAGGTYSITVTGTDSLGNTQTTLISFVVATVTTTISSANVSFSPGSTASATITTVGHSYTNNVVLGLTGLPAGVSYTLSPVSIMGGSGSSALTILAGADAQAGVYLVTIHSSAGGVVFSTTFTLTIT